MTSSNLKQVQFLFLFFVAIFSHLGKGSGCVRVDGQDGGHELKTHSGGISDAATGVQTIGAWG